MNWSPAPILLDINLPASWIGGFENATAILRARHPELSDADLMSRLLIAGIVGVVESEARIVRRRTTDFSPAAPEARS